MEIAPAMLAAHDGVGEAVPSPSTFTSESVSVGKNSYDDDDDEEEDVCRICRNPGDADNPLRYPCACSGSIKFVHQDCLLQWLNHSNARQCEVFDKTPETIVNPVFGESSSHTYVKGSYNLSGAGIPIEKWNGDGDFFKWQWTMKVVLKRNHVHTVVYAQDQLDPSLSALELFEMKEWAFTTLQMAMGDDVIPEVFSETTAEGIWKRLEELYLKKLLMNRWILTTSCLSFKMKEGTTMKNHLITFQDLIMKMKAFDVPLVHDEEALASGYYFIVITSR